MSDYRKLRLKLKGQGRVNPFARDGVAARSRSRYARSQHMASARWQCSICSMKH